jgi:hypothetical protein
MKMHRCVTTGAAILLLGSPVAISRTAHATPIPPVAPAATAPFPAPAVENTGVSDSLVNIAALTDIDDESLEEAATPLAERVHDLEQRLEQTRQVTLGRQPRITLGGYIDLGFFVPQGDGAGIIRDQGNTYFPQYAGRYGWVFLGDLLAPTVNSRGEAADLGDAAGVERFDSIHSGGAPGFVANEVNLTLTSALGDSALASASINFVPRTGSNFALGDFIDVDLAQLEWMPTKSQRTSIFVGKVDSLIGIEYRERKAAQRFGITPSLIARYTTGTALGLKFRSKLGPEDLLIIAGAISNGSNTTEQFHFYNELDTNAGKTASGRLALRPPLPFEVEAGVSGSYGSQDRARDSRGAMWFWGVDLQAHVSVLDFKAQYLRGSAPGSPADDVYGLKLHGGGYAEADVMITPMLGALGRAEFRDAFVWLGDATSAPGAERAYLTKSWRATGGVRLAFSDRVVMKAEYLFNREYGGVPQIANDIFTMSLLLID